MQFINWITLEPQTIGDGIRPCTNDINIVEAKVEGRSVVIIDTPGIDDTRAGVKQADIIARINRRLEEM